ncbi:hypothetical protein MRX96_047394 [Rhipicephalus microplus]
MLTDGGTGNAYYGYKGLASAGMPSFVSAPTAAAPLKRFRFRNSGSLSCAECPVVETIEHMLLQCPGYVDQSRQPFDAYGRLEPPN